MRAVRRLRDGAMALALAGGLTAALAACSSEGPILLHRIGAVAADSIAGPADEAPAPQLTRAELDRIPSATIALSVAGGPRAFLVPLADNGGYLDYRDAEGNALVMFGGGVSGTGSLGHDLQGVHYHRLDPIAHPTPLAEWPGRVHRDYQFTRRDLDEYSITLDCVFEPVARETIEIVEISFDLVRVNEVCTNARRQVTNTYWVQEDTGFVWKSEQWLGPGIGHLTVEIIRPYAG